MTDSRVDAAASYSEICQLLHKYNYFADYGDAEDMLGVFHPNATFILTYRGGVVYEGTAGLTEFFGDVYAAERANLAFCRHRTTVPHIKVNGDTADGIVYFDGTSRETTESPYTSSTGRYFDHYVREEGVWLIKSREVIVDASYVLEPMPLLGSE